MPIRRPDEDTMLETLAYVGGSRWRIESEFETEKGDVGLDEYGAGNCLELADYLTSHDPATAQMPPSHASASQAD